MLSRSNLPPITPDPFQGSPSTRNGPQIKTINWARLAGVGGTEDPSKSSGFRITTKDWVSPDAAQILGRKDDKTEALDDTDRMAEITREEFNAKLETIEVKMDARVESVSAKIDTFLAVQAERDKRLDESLSNIRGDISRLGNLKLSIWGAMFTGLAITLTVIGLGITSYQAGQADRHPAEIAQPALQPLPPSVK